MPLRGDARALNVNWFIMRSSNHAGKVTYRNSFITDLPVSLDTIAALAAAGRARWIAVRSK